VDQERRAAADPPERDADPPERDAGRAPVPRKGRLVALTGLAAGATMVVLALTGLTGVDRRLERIAGDAERAGAPKLRPAAYRAVGAEPCGRDERPTGAQRRL